MAAIQIGGWGVCSGRGMMVMGAVCGFAVAYTTGSPYLGILASIAAGVVMSVLFGFLTLTLVANQVATGLALTLLGLGLSGLIGEGRGDKKQLDLRIIGVLERELKEPILLESRLQLEREYSALEIHRDNVHEARIDHCFIIEGVRYKFLRLKPWKTV